MPKPRLGLLKLVKFETLAPRLLFRTLVVGNTCILERIIFELYKSKERVAIVQKMKHLGFFF